MCSDAHDALAGISPRFDRPGGCSIAVTWLESSDTSVPDKLRKSCVASVSVADGNHGASHLFLEIWRLGLSLRIERRNVTGPSAQRSSIQSEPESASKSEDFREGIGDGDPLSVPDQARGLGDALQTCRLRAIDSGLWL